VEFWHVLVKHTSCTGFQWQIPQVLSGYGRRFWLQYPTGNKEIDVDLSGLLGMCIPTWVKFGLFSRRKVILQISIVNHSGWAWPIRLQLWKDSSHGFSDVCISWLRMMQKMHFKTVTQSSNSCLMEKVFFAPLFSGERVRKTTVES
jgi:hypothetical protein